MFSKNSGVQPLRRDKDRLKYDDEICGKRGPKIQLCINIRSLRRFVETRIPDFGGTFFCLPVKVPVLAGFAVLLFANAASAALASVSLAWNKSTDSTIVGYNLIYGTSSGSLTQKQNVGNVITATVSNLTVGTTYYFAVTAYNSAGVNSKNSNIVSAVPSPTLVAGGTATPAPTPKSIAFVQVMAFDPQNSLAQIPLAFRSAQKAGNLNVVVVGWYDTTTSITSVTDSNGNPYTLAIGPTKYNPITQSIYYARNIKAGANTVTVKFNRAAAYPDIRMAEYSGINTTNPFDAAIGTGGSGGSLMSSGTIKTTNAKDLIVGAGYVYSAVTGPGSGFTSRIITPTDTNIFEDEVVNSIGSYSATAPMWVPSGAYVMQMVAFRSP